MNRAVFMVQKAYDKAIKRIMSAEDKIDFALASINEQIVRFGNARTACVEAGLSDKVSEIEAQIRKLAEQKAKLKEKRAEYVAKVKTLEAQLSAQKELSKCFGMNSGSCDDVIADLDRYIKHMEAELNTMEFINSVAV